VTLATPPFGKILRGHVRNVPENAHVKFKVRSFNLLELLAFNCQIFRGSRDHGHALFWENFNRVIYELTLETRMSSLMSVALTVLELLAFNAPKFRRSRDHGHAHFRGCSKTFSSGC